jgi:hypothetical protein
MHIMRPPRLKRLVDEVLDSIPTPHTEDVIEDVFLAIEHNPAWRRSYDEVVYELGKPATNAWTGFWVSHAEGRVGDQRETAARTTLIESYSKLVTPAAKRSKKVKEPEALKAMHDHYIANRASLPNSIVDQRDVIVALIREGIDVETAFAKAVEKPMFAW